MITTLMLVLAAAGYMIAPHLPGQPAARLSCLRTAGFARLTQSSQLGPSLLRSRNGHA